ncbi:MAG: hypothetical protein QNJ70_15900 [Xenococcaceae cyanobacterium MO_207.B15]|nr:hypothetical protein [Xenococcaceae cyanobacterium MO_207.B15]
MSKEDSQEKRGRFKFSTAKRAQYFGGEMNFDQQKTAYTKCVED